MKKEKKILFAIYRQGFHIGNQFASTPKSAIKNYLLLSGYLKEDIVNLNLEKKCIVIKALRDIHYISSTYKKNSLSDSIYLQKELDKLFNKEKKYNLLVSILKEKKEVYADSYNELILKEIYHYKNILDLSTLKNSFEIREWIISMKCQVLENEHNYKKIIKNTIVFGARACIY